jgi:hypothetical protein
MTINPKPTFPFQPRVLAKGPGDGIGRMPQTGPWARSTPAKARERALAFEREQFFRDPDGEAGRGRLGLAY